MGRVGGIGVASSHWGGWEGLSREQVLSVDLDCGGWNLETPGPRRALRRGQGRLPGGGTIQASVLKEGIAFEELQAAVYLSSQKSKEVLNDRRESRLT